MSEAIKPELPKFKTFESVSVTSPTRVTSRWKVGTLADTGLESDKPASIGVMDDTGKSVFSFTIGEVDKSTRAVTSLDLMKHPSQTLFPLSELPDVIIMKVADKLGVIAKEAGLEGLDKKMAVRLFSKQDVSLSDAKITEKVNKELGSIAHTDAKQFYQEKAKAADELPLTRAAEAQKSARETALESGASPEEAAILAKQAGHAAYEAARKEAQGVKENSTHLAEVNEKAGLDRMGSKGAPRRDRADRDDSKLFESPGWAAREKKLEALREQNNGQSR